MELNKINSLVELFFKKCEKNDSLVNQSFLKWLKPNKSDSYSWGNVQQNIIIITEFLKKNLSKGDRCILSTRMVDC